MRNIEKNMSVGEINTICDEKQQALNLTKPALALDEKKPRMFSDLKIIVLLGIVQARALCSRMSPSDRE